MFCSAVRVGSRLNAWKTNPMRSRRSTVRSRSFRPVSSTPAIRIEPDVAVSRPASKCIRVDLPEPDGPTIAVNSPAGNVTLTLSTAVTVVSPSPYTFTNSSARTAWVVVISASSFCGRRRIYGRGGPARVVGKNGVGVLLKEDTTGERPPQVHQRIVGRYDDIVGGRAEAERVTAGTRSAQSPAGRPFTPLPRRDLRAARDAAD